MTDQERERLEKDLEQSIGDLLRERNVLMNGTMCKRVEMVAQLIADIASIKQQPTSSVWDEAIRLTCEVERWAR